MRQAAFHVGRSKSAPFSCIHVYDLSLVKIVQTFDRRMDHGSIRILEFRVFFDKFQPARLIVISISIKASEVYPWELCFISCSIFSCEFAS
jgi:hypothetical protein